MRRRIGEPMAAVAGALAFALLGASRLRGHFGDIIGFGDWDSWYELQWAAYRSVHDFHQLPLWNPWRCGGMPLLGNPESHIATPWFLLTLISGPFAGLKLELPILMAVGWLGGYVLGRVLKMEPLAALGPAFAFASSSWFFERAVFGQISMLAFAYMPWIFAGAEKGAEDFRYTALAGAIMGLVFLEGGPYPFAIILVALILVAGGELALNRSPRSARILPIIVLFSAGFSAVKLFPALGVAVGHPRPTSAIQANTLEVLRAAVFSIDQRPMRGSPNGWGFWEAGAYVGFFAIPAAIGLADPKRAGRWLFATVFLLWLARGDAGWLWPILHRAPVFGSLRIPSRFLIPMTLTAGVMAGFGLQRLCDLRLRRAGKIAAFLLLAGASVNAMLVSMPLMEQVINNLQRPAEPDAVFRQIRAGPGNNLQLIPAMENHGVVRCYAYTSWSSGVTPAGDPGYRGEQYLLGPGTISLLHWSPDRLTYSVDIPGRAVMVVNQNYDPGWRIAGGEGEVVPLKGLLAVRLPAGRRIVSLRYASLSAIFGAIVTLATFAVAVVMWSGNDDFAASARSLQRRLAVLTKG
jgi:hypothetical protein